MEKSKNNIEKIYLLTPMQEGMLFHSIKEKSDAYFDQLFYTITGEIDLELFSQSLGILSKRHDILRTAFVYEKTERPIQVVLRNRKIEVSILDKSSLTDIDYNSFLEKYKDDDIRKGFDLVKKPLIRISIIKRSETIHDFLWSYHHILLDGWCHTIMVEELDEIYKSLKNNITLDLPEPIHFDSYVKWLEKKNPLESKNYWKSYLEGYDHITEIPKIINRDFSELKNPQYAIKFSKQISEQLAVIAKKYNITLNDIFQTVWGLLLAKYSNSNDVVYGNVVSGRPSELKGVERCLGMFINTIPVRFQYKKEYTLIALAKRNHEDFLNGMPYHYNSLAEIQNETNLKADLIKHVIAFENYPLSASDKEENDQIFKISNVDSFARTNYDLDVDIELEEEIKSTFFYNPDNYHPDYIERIANSFEVLIHQFVENPVKEIKDLSFISEKNTKELLHDFNQKKIDLNNTTPINVLFEEQVLLNENVVSVIHNNQKWTYKQLNAKANKIANTLIENGFEKGNFVGLHLDRCPELVAALLGVFKAGGVYVPLDTQNPSKKTLQLIEDGEINALISDCKLLDNLAITGFFSDNLKQVLSIDGDIQNQDNNFILNGRACIENNSIKNPENINEITDWAYMLYTSGSTGKPKGAITRYNGAINHIFAEYKALDLQDGFCFLQSASIASDISVWQILAPLLKGGSVLIADKGDVLDYQKTLHLMKEHNVTIAEFVPSYLIGFVDYILELKMKDNILPSLRWMMTSGEEVPVKLVNDWLQLFPNCKVLNAYGPCETSDDIAQYEITSVLPEYTQKVPIGKPIHNMNIFVLDDNEKLVPIGVAGEICVSGVGVGAGYFKAPEKTAKSFKPNPFKNNLGDTIYKTDDLGRWLPNGNLEFLGRKDRQVKIRGNRVELGEIEAFIREIDFVENVAVIAYKKSSFDIFLIAFITKADSLTKEEELKTVLFSKSTEGLAYYMQPTEYCFVDIIPKNLSDKVDEKGLITLYEDRINGGLNSKKQIISCKTETEKEIKAIWENILQISEIGADHDFFENGGHSLLAMRVKSAIFKRLKVDVEIQDLFAYTKLSELAKYVEQSSISKDSIKIESQEKPIRIPLSYAQESLWFIDNLQGNTTEYNISAIIKLKGNLNVNLLEASLRAIINRHETLRSIVLSDSGISYLSFLEAENWMLSYVDNTYDSLDEKIKDLVYQSFNLATDFKLKAHIIQQDNTENILVLVMHHIASDGWSDSILVDEFLSFYQAGLNNTEADVPELPIQYSDYILWQRENKAKLDNQITYWKENLKDVTILEFPTDYPRSKNESNEGESVIFSIDKKLSRQLKELSTSNGSTLYMTLLSAFKILLYKYSGQKDICVGTPIAGRVNQDLENLIGFFVNMIVLRSDVQPTMYFKDFLKEVKNTSLNAYKNQDIPFEKVVEITTKQRDLSRNPLHQVLFTLQNTPELKEIVLGDLDVSLLKPNYLQVLSDLHFLLEEDLSKDTITLEIEYRKSLFDVTTIERLGVHYIQLLKSIVENPFQKISELEILSSHESKILLDDFNDTTVNYIKDQTIVDLFNKIVSKTPNSVAVVFKENLITYKDLEQMSNKFANYLLIKKEIKVEDLIGVKVERSDWLIIVLLGVLKSGGVYIPIDPNYPQERIDYIEKDSDCKIIIDSAFMEEYQNESDSYLASKPIDVNISTNNLAYVIYTSGSTGKPKGVMIEHKGIVNTILAQIPIFRITEGTRCLQFANQCFDASIWEILLSIIGGGSLYVIEDDKKTDIDYFINFLNSNLIDCAVIPPAYLKILDIKDLKSLKTLVTGGEEAPLEQVKLFKKQGGNYVNAYGPTESSICSTSFEGDISNSVPIGKPITNTEAYILNETLSLSPIGVIGELCVSGAGLARGYLNNEELTKKKFIKHPFKKGLRLYKTGDLAKWLPDGNIEFIGRLDNQVKIRGYRIELGEIENTILKHEDIYDCCVIVQKDNVGTNYLIGYLVKKDDLENKDLERYIKSKLPEYMVPKQWMVLTQMPLTSSGKIDKRSLPKPELNSISTKEYVAARNNTEETLVLIWQELLNIDKIGIYDDFFELGGHSLLVTQLVSIIRERLSIELAIKDIFEFKTIEELASYIRYKDLDKFEKGETKGFNVSIEI